MSRFVFLRFRHSATTGVWLIMLALAVILTIRASAATALPTGGAVAQIISDEVQQQVATKGSARVLLLLGEVAPTGIAAPPSVATAAEQTAAVAALQSQVLQTLAPTEFQLYRQYQYVPGLAGTVSAAGLTKLRNNPLVRAIGLDHPGGAHLQQSVPALGGDIVHTTYGITGRGVTVAVLDSGIDTDHPDLADDLVAQHCFTNGACPGNTSESKSAEDANGHGTHVAGIISSKGIVSGKGFAPNAKLVAVRVLDSGGGGFVADWVAGLDWVRSQLAVTPVRIVNMSLGTFALYPDSCDGQEALLAHAITQLRAQGVAIFASSGNQGAATRIAAPACNSGAIAVGATYDSDVGRQPGAGTYQSSFGSSWPACADTPTTLQTITCFTNSNQQLDLLAPGAPILSSYKGGGTATYWGTSQASPAAAGVAALLLEKRPTLKPSELETILENTGQPVIDPSNGLTFPAINALAALKAVIPITPTAVTLTSPVTGITGVGYTFTAKVTPITVTMPITYRWQATDLPVVTQVGTQQKGYTFTWSAPGQKEVTVTAINEGGQISATKAITIMAIAPVTATLDGPMTLSTGVTSTFLTTVAPVTATTPITYVWQRNGYPPITHTNGITDRLTLDWSEPGIQTVTVTLTNNAGGVTATHQVTVQSVAPSNLTLDAIPITRIGHSTFIRAQVSPIITSLPLTYTWQATGQPTLTHVTGNSDIVVYQWLTAGAVTITVQAENRAGAVFAQHELLVIDERQFYLPLIQGP